MELVLKPCGLARNNWPEAQLLMHLLCQRRLIHRRPSAQVWDPEVDQHVNHCYCFDPRWQDDIHAVLTVRTVKAQLLQPEPLRGSLCP